MRLVSAIYRDWYPFDQMFTGAAVSYTSDPKDLQEGDILIVWGGADISPSLYNKKPSSFTYATEVPSSRDKIEWELMKRAKEINVPIIGVCRGAQMLTALAGGYLVQHLDNHAGPDHLVKTSKEELMLVNSIHHQMCVPFKVEHTLLAWSAPALSDIYIDEYDIPIEVPFESELIYYPGHGLAIQWHPEGIDVAAPCQTLIFDSIKEYLL